MRVRGMLLPAWFVVMCLAWGGFHLDSLGADAHLYYKAAEAYVAGQDPWNLSGSWGLYQFSGLPSTVLAFVPFLWLPGKVAAYLWVAMNAASAVFIVRRLGLPWWWLLFPPIVGGVWIGNPHVALLALLLTRFAPLAPLVKVYTVVPMIGERRLRQLVICAALFAASIAIAPDLWRHWFENAGTISQRLVFQSRNFSAWSFPPLEAVGVVLLALLGLRRAGWLAVPVLWPGTSILYGSLCMPVASPVLGFFFAIPMPGATLVGLAAEWGLHRAQKRHEQAADHEAERAGRRDYQPAPTAGP